MAKGADWRGSASLVIQKEIIELFEQEGKVWESISSLDGVVKLYEFNQTPFPWFVMEYMDAGTLVDKMETVEIKEALKYALTLLNVLDKFHKNNIIHRDIKPENIMFNSDGKLKLTDFGLAKVLGSKQSKVMFKGTYDYSAPEQFTLPNIGPVDTRTDIYQVGAVLYKMLTKQIPISLGKNPTIDIMELKPRPPSEFNKYISKNLDYVILKALEKKKEDRWQNAEDFKKQLEEVLRSVK